MTLPIVLAKSLLSLTLLSAAAPAGGAITAASTEVGDSGSPSAGTLRVTRTVTAFEGADGTIQTLTEGGTPHSFSIALSSTAEGQALTTGLTMKPDPLELAKTYAPETVDEWTAILEQYKAKVKPQVFKMQVNTAPAGEGEGNAALPMKIAIRDLAEQGVNLEAVPAEGGAAFTPVAVDIRRAVVVEGGAATADAVTAVAPVVSVFQLDEGIVKAQIALGKVLDGGQTEEIRTALQQLLTAFQTFLEEK